MVFFFSGLGVLDVCLGGIGSGGGGDMSEIVVIWDTLLDLAFTDSELFFVNVAGRTGNGGAGVGLERSG